MSKMLRVALISDAVPTAGGAFTHARNVADALSAWGGAEIVNISLSARGTGVGRLSYGRAERAMDDLGARLPIARRAFGMAQGSRLDGRLAALGIDLAVFPEPSWHAPRLARTNFVATVLDVCHRDHPEFPEVRAGREFEDRERLNAATLTRAVAVLVDSPQLKDKVAAFYGVDPARIVVLPYKPSAELVQCPVVPGAGARPRPYLLYPAQFWAHKNHAYLLEAVAALRVRGLELDVVFCGSDKGNRAFVEGRTRDLGLHASVEFKGFIPVAELASLYRNALALAMPTYFGPTNIPPLEAMALGCPVIISDLPEFRSAYGWAALYCDLADPGSLADHVAALLAAPATRGALIRRGKAKARAVQDIQYGSILEPVLDSLAKKLSTHA